MSSEPIELVRGDTKPSLYFAITDLAGTVEVLTGCTVNFYFRKLGASALKNTGHTACVIYDAAGGLCRYDWVAADLDTQGQFIGELEVTYSDNGIQTIVDTWTFKIREDVQ